MKKLQSILKTMDVAALQSEESSPAQRPDDVRRTESPAIRRLIPTAVPIGGLPEERTRSYLVSRKRGIERLLKNSAQEVRDAGSSATERAEAYAGRDYYLQRLEDVNGRLTNGFVPQHAPSQIISADLLLASKLFNVKNSATPRHALLRFELGSPEDGPIFYRGPELRQSDGIVFMALVNSLRDVPAGHVCQFSPQEMCQAIYGYYDGRARAKLKETVLRLMQAVITFPAFSVQLAQNFQHPSTGMWEVAIDKSIVRLFQEFSYTWLDFHLHRQLADGIQTWLYAYVRTQAYLRPVALKHLMELSGSEANSEKPFRRSLNRALIELSKNGVIDSDYAIKGGVLTWRKAKQQ